MGLRKRIGLIKSLALNSRDSTVHQQFLNIRGARLDDANSIIDIDIKCFETAWSPEEWSAIGQKPGHAISVATNYGNVVGFAVFRHDSANTAIEVVKIAVKEKYRRQLISVQLLLAGAEYAHARFSQYLYIVVPESTIYPGEKNVSNWLKAVGFEAKNFIKKHFNAYGDTEDGVRFVHPLKKKDIT